MQTRLYIEGIEVELDKNVQFSITKQFEDITNPTTIINDWSKTVEIPFTENNNKLFGHIYCPDKVIAEADDEKIGVYFDATKKLNFRLDYGDSVLMSGYAKMTEIKQTDGKGVYCITLNGELGRIFQEMKKITFDKTSVDTDYIISGEDYIDENVSRDLVEECWGSNGQETLELQTKYIPGTQTINPNWKISDIIGFTPNNSLDENFDASSFEVTSDYVPVENDFLQKTDEFLEENAHFETTHKISASTLIGDGLSPRAMHDFRSYLQIPFIYFNKLFQIVKEKFENITDYTINFDNSWFNESNVYWKQLVVILKKLNIEKNEMESSDAEPMETTMNWNYDIGVARLNPGKGGRHSTTVKIGTPDLFGCTTSGSYIIQLPQNRYSHTFKFRFPINFNIQFNPEILRQYPDYYFGFIKKSYFRIYITLHKIDNDNVDTTLKTFDYAFVDRDGAPDLPYTKKIMFSRTQISSLSTINPGIVTSAGDVFEFTITANSNRDGNCRYYVVYNGWWESQDDLVVNTPFGLYERETGEDTHSLEVASYINSISLFISPVGYSKDFLNIRRDFKSKHSYQPFNLNDLWNNEVSPFDIILNYCKMFRIVPIVDNIAKTITFKQLTNYFSDYTIEDYTNKLVKSKDFIIKPLTFGSKYLLFNYEDTETLLGQRTKETTGYNFGEKNVITNYNFGTETKKLFSGLKPPIVKSPTLTLFADLYKQHSSPNSILKYRLVPEVYVENSDKDNKSSDLFGTFYFFYGRTDFAEMSPPDDRITLSDDSNLQLEKQIYAYYSPADSNVFKYSQLDIYTYDDDNLCTFEVPAFNYTYLSNYEGKKGIYYNFWQKYIEERYNIQNKLVTCYLRLTPHDFMNFNWNNFILIENQLYFVNKIYDYDVTGDGITKVDLITIQDISGYTTNNYIN